LVARSPTRTRVSYHSGDDKGGSRKTITAICLTDPALEK
jgi:hypothetical protein